MEKKIKTKIKNYKSKSKKKKKKGSKVGRMAQEGSLIKLDLDLEKKFVLKKEDIERLLNRIERDTNFLENHNLLDYSLLAGIFSCEFYDLIPPHLKLNCFELNDPSAHYLIVSIIDLCTSMNNRKNAEMSFKSLMFKRENISTVPPPQYNSRFKIFIRESFIFIN